MRYCPRCGKENDDDAVFCKSCGTDLRAGSQTGEKSGFEKGMEDFGKEMDNLGKRLEREFEGFGKGVETWTDSTLGIAGPLVWSLVGLLVLFLIIWALGWLGNWSPSSGDIGSFLLANVWLIFALGLLLSYGNFFSRRYREQFRWVQPVFTALGLVFGLWIFSEIAMIVAINLNIEILDTISSIISTYLAVIFLVVLVIGYVVFLVTILGVVEENRTQRTGQQPADSPRPPQGEYRRLYRSGRSRFLGGVCGGLGEYANIDPNIVRILWILLLVVSMGIAIIAYLLMWILIPRNPRDMWE